MSSVDTMTTKVFTTLAKRTSMSSQNFSRMTRNTKIHDVASIRAVSTMITKKMMNLSDSLKQGTMMTTIMAHTMRLKKSTTKNLTSLRRISILMLNTMKKRSMDMIQMMKQANQSRNHNSLPFQCIKDSSMVTIQQEDITIISSNSHTKLIIMVNNLISFSNHSSLFSSRIMCFSKHGRKRLQGQADLKLIQKLSFLILRNLPQLNRRNRLQSLYNRYQHKKKLRCLQLLKHPKILSNKMQILKLKKLNLNHLPSLQLMLKKNKRSQRPKRIP